MEGKGEQFLRAVCPKNLPVKAISSRIGIYRARPGPSPSYAQIPEEGAARGRILVIFSRTIPWTAFRSEPGLVWNA